MNPTVSVQLPIIEGYSDHHGTSQTVMTRDLRFDGVPREGEEIEIAGFGGTRVHTVWWDSETGKQTIRLKVGYTLDESLADATARLREHGWSGS